MFSLEGTDDHFLGSPGYVKSPSRDANHSEPPKPKVFQCAPNANSSFLTYGFWKQTRTLTPYTCILLRKCIPYDLMLLVMATGISCPFQSWCWCLGKAGLPPLRTGSDLIYHSWEKEGTFGYWIFQTTSESQQWLWGHGWEIEALDSSPGVWFWWMWRPLKGAGDKV